MREGPGGEPTVIPGWTLTTTGLTGRGLKAQDEKEIKTEFSF